MWNFTIERAPWWGGYWERLVQSIKRPLKKVLGRSTLNFDELNTVLVEIESVINSRPITLTNQWRKEYLTSLRERRQPQSRDNKEGVSVGDLVVLKNDSTSRIYWKLAKVEELIYGADGKARAAVVKVANNTNRPVYLRRVIQHLIPIEVQACTRQITQRELSRPETRVNDNQRPRRIAAVVGEINRRDINIS